MGDLTSRHAEGSDHPHPKKRCQRCVSLSIKIQKNWTDHTSRMIDTISPETLQADCALCVQFGQVFKSKYSSPPRTNPTESVYLQYLCNVSPQEEIVTVGVGTLCLSTSRTVEFFPIQCAEFAYPQVVRHMVCLDEPDYQFIRTQLDVCKKSHGRECAHSMVGRHVMRVIDCKSRRLVTPKPDQPYVCLSYVWGASAAQETYRSGDELPAEMPKTIEDAMVVAIALEIPFLWVDRYCIDQGNLQEKHDTIQNMHKIYEGAEITIIAACGDDPHHGLPGVQSTPRNPQLSFTLADTTFVATESIKEEIHTTKWANRGWTYQEMLLSRRRLVFTKTQMYFQCRTTHCMETLHPSFTASKFTFRQHYRAFPTQGIGHTLVDLKERVQEYYRRQLSFHTDTINAFKGIVSAFDQSESFPFRLTHFYGVLMIHKHEDEHLARRSFVSNLFWMVTEGSREYRVVESLVFPRSKLFPSWSWASTKTNSWPDNYLTTPQYEFDTIGLSHLGETQVYFSHKTDGDMDACAFSKHRDGYDMFLPLMKLNTWVVPCPLSSRVYGKAIRRGYGSELNFQPEASCRVLHLAYLGIETHEKHSIWLRFLILEGMERGVFRRIKRRSAAIPMSVDDCNSNGETLDIALSARYKSAWFDMNPNVDGREFVSQPQWERKTINVV